MGAIYSAVSGEGARTRKFTKEFLKREFGPVGDDSMDRLTVRLGTTSRSIELRALLDEMDFQVVALEKNIYFFNRKVQGFKKEKRLLGAGFRQEMVEWLEYLRGWWADNQNGGVRTCRDRLLGEYLHIAPRDVVTAIQELTRRLLSVEEASRELANDLELHIKHFDNVASALRSGWAKRDPRWKRKDEEYSAITIGTVYVLESASAPGRFKIGFTTRTVAERASEVQVAYGIERPFKEAYSVRCDFPYIVEQRVFDKLRPKNYNAEMVEETLDAIIRAINEAVAEVKSCIVDGRIVGLKPVYDPNIIPKSAPQRFQWGDWVYHSNLGPGWIQSCMGGPGARYVIWFKDGTLRKEVLYGSRLLTKVSEEVCSNWVLRRVMGTNITVFPNIRKKD